MSALLAKPQATVTELQRVGAMLFAIAIIPVWLGAGAGGIAGLVAAGYMVGACIPYGPVGWLLAPFFAGVTLFVVGGVAAIFGAVALPLAVIAELGFLLVHGHFYWPI